MAQCNKTARQHYNLNEISGNGIFTPPDEKMLTTLRKYGIMALAMTAVVVTFAILKTGVIWL